MKVMEMTDEQLKKWCNWFVPYGFKFSLERGSSRRGAYAIEINGEVYFDTKDIARKVIYPKWGDKDPVLKERYV